MNQPSLLCLPCTLYPLAEVQILMKDIFIGLSREVLPVLNALFVFTCVEALRSKLSARGTVNVKLSQVFCASVVLVIPPFT